MIASDTAAQLCDYHFSLEKSEASQRKYPKQSIFPCPTHSNETLVPYRSKCPLGIKLIHQIADNQLITENISCFPKLPRVNILQYLSLSVVQIVDHTWRFAEFLRITWTDSHENDHVADGEIFLFPCLRGQCECSSPKQSKSSYCHQQIMLWAAFVLDQENSKLHGHLNFGFIKFPLPLLKQE